MIIISRLQYTNFLFLALFMNIFVREKIFALPIFLYESVLIFYL